MTQAQWPESEYRAEIARAYARIERSLADQDPDVVECDVSQGSLTLTFGDKSRCILSAQPSVRQLWVALAAAGVAHHLNWDPTQKVWLDDKGKGVELFALLVDVIRDRASVEARF